MHISYTTSEEIGKYFSISRPIMGEHICPWANGDFGSMVDIYESDTLRFIDYYYELDSHGNHKNIRIKHLTDEDRKQCPIVAEGIVVYWMKWCCDNALQYDAAQLFDDYYDNCFKDYERWQSRRFDYWKHKPHLPLNFAIKHLTDERKRIATSKALTPYLLDRDNELIKGLTENYIEYVKNKVKQLRLSQGNISETISTERLTSAILVCKGQGLVWSASAYAVFYRVLQQDYDEECGRSKFEERLQLMGFDNCTSGTLDNAFRNNKFLPSPIEKWPEGEGQNKDKAIRLAEAFRKALEE